MAHPLCEPLRAATVTGLATLCLLIGACRCDQRSAPEEGEVQSTSEAQGPASAPATGSATDGADQTVIHLPIDNEQEAIAQARTDPEVQAFLARMEQRGFAIETMANFSDEKDLWIVVFSPKDVRDLWIEVHVQRDGTIVFTQEGDV